MRHIAIQRIRLNDSTWIHKGPQRAATDKTDYSHRKQTMSNHTKINEKAQEKIHCNREKRKAIQSVGANLHWNKRGANLWREAHLGGTLWQDGSGLKKHSSLKSKKMTLWQDRPGLNKLASLEAKLVWNYNPPTQWLSVKSLELLT